MRKVLYILGQLSDEDVEWIASNGTRKTLAEGDTIITMGQQSDSIYILLHGEMVVSVDHVGEIARLNSGEIIGEMSLVDASPPSATVTAATKSHILEVSKKLLNEKMEKDILFAAHFYRAIAIFLSHRLRGTVKRLGYGKDVSLEDDIQLDGELDANVLDNVYLAGARFERMLKKLMGSG